MLRALASLDKRRPRNVFAMSARSAHSASKSRWSRALHAIQSTKVCPLISICRRRCIYFDFKGMTCEGASEVVVRYNYWVAAWIVAEVDFKSLYGVTTSDKIVTALCPPNYCCTDLTGCSYLNVYTDRSKYTDFVSSEYYEWSAGGNLCALGRDVDGVSLCNVKYQRERFAVNKQCLCAVRVSSAFRVCCICAQRNGYQRHASVNRESPTISIRFAVYSEHQ